VLCYCCCSLSVDLLDRQWLQQHEARIVQQLQEDGWTSSSKASPPKAKQRQQQANAQLQASVRSAAAAGLSPQVACLLLSVHERCGYVMRNDQLRQVCQAMAAAMSGSRD
jgi:hypothetical protein